MAASEHNSILGEAAKSALQPIGYMRKGRSRIWLDDQAWWIGIVEFQPSSWGKGSYLNVAPCWLWAAKKNLSFDDGEVRFNGYIEFRTVEQFTDAARQLADHAKEEALKIRARYPTLEATATHLNNKTTRDGDIWGHYHAGVSAGLVGWRSRAHNRLKRVVETNEIDAEWVQLLKAQSAELLLMLGDIEQFRSRISEVVANSRLTLKLPVRKDSACLEF